MSLSLSKLFKAEFRRQWSLTTIFAVVIVSVIVGLIGSIATGFEARRAGNAVAVEHLLMRQIPSLVSFITAILAIGIVANDVKDGWLRTLLIRPITRQQYLMTRVASVFCTVWIVVVVGGLAPIAVRAVTTDLVVQFDPMKSASLIGIFISQSMLDLMILSFFSCWVPGVVNVILYWGWMIGGALLSSYIDSNHWDSEWLETAKEYFLPSGFGEATEVVYSGGFFPTSELLWGFAALTGFSALAFWSITKIQVDQSWD